MRIETSPGITTNTVNKAKTVTSNNNQDGFVLHWEEGKGQTALGISGGKNVTFSPKEGLGDSVYSVTEYLNDQKIKEYDIDIDKVDAHDASYLEMWLLAMHTDSNGYTKDFIYRIDAPFSAVYGVGNWDKVDEKIDFYAALKLEMEADKREGYYQHYLATKSFFDYYDKEIRGVPALLL